MCVACVGQHLCDCGCVDTHFALRTSPQEQWPITALHGAVSCVLCTALCATHPRTLLRRARRSTTHAVAPPACARCVAADRHSNARALACPTPAAHCTGCALHGCHELWPGSGGRGDGWAGAGAPATNGRRRPDPPRWACDAGVRPDGAGTRACAVLVVVVVVAASMCVVRDALCVACWRCGVRCVMRYCVCVVACVA